MSLRPHALEPVPEETARVARAAFPKGHHYLLQRDTLGTLFQDDDFATCFPLEGQPGLSPWRLALITIMQFRKNLADRQAAEAVRARIDWQYLLGLALTDPGFDFSVLSEFRDRLLASRAEELHAGQAPPGADAQLPFAARAPALKPSAARQLPESLVKSPPPLYPASLAESHPLCLFYTTEIFGLDHGVGHLVSMTAPGKQCLNTTKG